MAYISLDDLKTALSEIKTTASGKVEFNNNSLSTVLSLIQLILVSRGMVFCGTTAEMSDLSPAEGGQAFVAARGIFILQSVAPGTAPDNATTFASTQVGMLWTLQPAGAVPAGPAFLISSPSSGQYLVYNSGTNSFQNQTISPSPPWASITGKPVIAIRGGAAFSLPGTPTYAGNSQALAGGLVADDVYKLSSGELRIVV